MKRIAVFTFLVLTGCAKIKGDAGAPGIPGERGLAGVAGVTGPTGNQGNPGTNGVNAASITPIQLCNGFTPNYPNTFPEYALCLQGKLYGVYSDHGGFLAELPPGRYSSNGINSSCTFNVGANCEASQ